MTFRRIWVEKPGHSEKNKMPKSATYEYLYYYRSTSLGFGNISSRSPHRQAYRSVFASTLLPVLEKSSSLEKSFEGVYATFRVMRYSRTPVAQAIRCVAQAIRCMADDAAFVIFFRHFFPPLTSARGLLACGQTTPSLCATWPLVATCMQRLPKTVPDNSTPPPLPHTHLSPAPAPLSPLNLHPTP